MHVEGGKVGIPTRGDGQPKISTYHVVHTCIVRLIKEIECFNHELQAGFLSHLETTAQTHVEGDKIRSNTGIVGCANRTVVGGMPVAVYVRASKQVKGMSCVVAQNRRKLKV